MKTAIAALIIALIGFLSAVCSIIVDNDLSGIFYGSVNILLVFFWVIQISEIKGDFE